MSGRCRTDCWWTGLLLPLAYAEPGGANIPLVVPTGGAKVTFYYDNTSHWVTADLTAPIVTAAHGAVADGQKLAPNILRRGLGPVEIHLEFITAAARWMIAAKL